jgi:hypothetical protein
VVRPKFPGQRFLIFSSCDPDRSKPHFYGVLHPQVTKSAESKDRYDIAGARRAITKTIESRDSSAHERSRFDRRQFFRDRSNGYSRSNHVIRVTAIEADAGNQG